MNWSQVLTWAAHHATDLPKFIQLVLAFNRDRSWSAFMALALALKDILADFPLPANDLHFMSAPLDMDGVSALDAAEFKGLIES